MKAIKDFLYKNNDIIIVLLIIALGVGVIYVKTENILHYKSEAPVMEANKSSNAEENASEPSDSMEEENLAEEAEDNSTTSDKNLEIVVDSDSSVEQVSTMLFERRITKTEDEFLKKMEEYEDTRLLQPGTYTIDLDESIDSILKKITKIN